MNEKKGSVEAWLFGVFFFCFYSPFLIYLGTLQLTLNHPDKVPVFFLSNDFMPIGFEVTSMSLLK